MVGTSVSIVVFTAQFAPLAPPLSAQLAGTEKVRSGTVATTHGAVPAPDAQPVGGVPFEWSVMRITDCPIN